MGFLNPNKQPTRAELGAGVRRSANIEGGKAFRLNLERPRGLEQVLTLSQAASRNSRFSSQASYAGKINALRAAAFSDGPDPSLEDRRTTTFFAAVGIFGVMVGAAGLALTGNPLYALVILFSIAMVVSALWKS